MRWFCARRVDGAVDPAQLQAVYSGAGDAPVPATRGELEKGLEYCLSLVCRLKHGQNAVRASQLPGETRFV